MSDVRDILELDQGGQSLPPTKEAIVGSGRTRKTRKQMEPTLKRPEGMHRELYALLYSDNRDSPPLAPSDSSQGYKQMKAKLGRKHVRAWKWTPFTNPARQDGAVFYHWRRAPDATKDYPFARFNKKVDVPEFTDDEYQVGMLFRSLNVRSIWKAMYLHDGPPSTWTGDETNHLFSLCRRFDLRFIVIHDKFNKDRFQARTIEELKDRYYSCVTRLLKARVPAGQEPPNLPYVFDAQHETERKKQLTKIFSRTAEQVREEEYLMTELKKIELRKKEREKKQQDLQKLITAAENQADYRQRRGEKKPIKKKPIKKKGELISDKPLKVDQAGVKFPESKGAGVCLRSSRMKMPASVGTKKAKAVEQLLEELGVDLQPMPTEVICQQFNELRNDMILLYELKQAAGNCEFELQTLKHRLEACGKDMSNFKLNAPMETVSTVPKVSGSLQSLQSLQSATPLIDAVSPAPGTPNPQRKRRTAAVFLDQNPLKKIKKM